MVEILVGRVLQIDRDMDVRHTETADARGLIRQRLLMGMKAEIDDMPDTEGVDVGELRFGRLAGRGDSLVETTPCVVSQERVGGPCFSRFGSSPPVGHDQRVSQRSPSTYSH